MDNALAATLILPHNIVASDPLVQPIGPGVPSIDFVPFLAGTPGGKRHVAQAIRDACEGAGFFYLTGHGVPQDAIGEIFAASQRFFAMPLDERMKVRLTIGPNRGYQPLGARIYTGQADAPDLNESFKYQHELPEDDPDIVAGDRVHARNRWPDGLPGWRETLLGYYAHMERLTDGLLRAFALALDLDESWFFGAYRKPLTQINLIHYPPHPPVTAGRQFGLRPHSDTRPSRSWHRATSADCRWHPATTGSTCHRSPATS
jgi:isopenicillin N synthase-like dioxygenase